MLLEVNGDKHVADVMKMNKLLIPLVVMLISYQATALDAQVASKLVVLLTVEGLRADLLKDLSPYFLKDGFNKLLKEGEVYSRIEHPLISADPVASYAILNTGLMGAMNGVPSRMIFNKDTRTMLSVFSDPGYFGVGTVERYSPRALNAMTIADQFYAATSELGKIYSVAPFAEEAIVAGGQRATGVYWIDSDTGKWATSSFYPNGLPWYIERANRLFYSLQKGISWTPLLSSYQSLLCYQSPYPFHYKYNTATSSIEDFKNSPLVNDEITQVALAILKNADLGKDNNRDLLCLHYTVESPDYSRVDVTPEVLDAYIRLDQTISTLLTHLPKSAMVVLMGDAMSKVSQPQSEPNRTFYTDNCKALLNMFLSVKFGLQGAVQDVIPEGQVFLNLPKDPDRIEEIEDATVSFLLEMSGVQYALSDAEIRKRHLYEGGGKIWRTALNLTTHKQRGNVVFGVLPGWGISANSQSSLSNKIRYAPIPSLMILFASDIAPKKIDIPLELTEVTTTVCNALRIRPPNP